jgi:GNAT superfamily N-acetyltransferase
MMSVTCASFSTQDCLPDGSRVYLRAIHPDDRKSLREELFLKLSPESLRNRFFGPKLDLTPRELSYFTDVDFLHHVAFVAEVECGPHRRLVGVGRFVRGNGKSDHAEIAITVIDEFQGKGIGSLLLRQLINCARELGVVKLEGSMFAQNTGMAKLLRKTRLPYRSRHESGMVSMSLDL